MCSEDVCSGAILPCRNYDRNVLLTGCEHPAVLRVNLIVLLENAAADELVDYLPREESLAIGLHLIPNLYEMVLQTAECLLLRDAGICNAVHMVVEKLLLLCRSEIPIVGNPVVVVVCHEVHDVLLEVVCGAGYNLNLVLTDHLGE